MTQPHQLFCPSHWPHTSSSQSSSIFLIWVPHSSFSFDISPAPTSLRHLMEVEVHLLHWSPLLCFRPGCYTAGPRFLCLELRSTTHGGLSLLSSLSCGWRNWYRFTTSNDSLSFPPLWSSFTLNLKLPSWCHPACVSRARPQVVMAVWLSMCTLQHWRHWVDVHVTWHWQRAWTVHTGSRFRHALWANLYLGKVRKAPCISRERRARMLGEGVQCPSLVAGFFFYSSKMACSNDLAQNLEC